MTDEGEEGLLCGREYCNAAITEPRSDLVLYCLRPRVSSLEPCARPHECIRRVWLTVRRPCCPRPQGLAWAAHDRQAQLRRNLLKGQSEYDRAQHGVAWCGVEWRVSMA